MFFFVLSCFMNSLYDHCEDTVMFSSCIIFVLSKLLFSLYLFVIFVSLFLAPKYLVIDLPACDEEWQEGGAQKQTEHFKHLSGDWQT